MGVQVHLKTGKRANFRGHQLWIVSIEGIDSVEKVRRPWETVDHSSST